MKDDSRSPGRPNKAKKPARKSRSDGPASEGRDSGWVLSRRAVFLWGLGLSLLLVWVFVLGVLVGRGIVFQDERFQDLVRRIERLTGGDHPVVTIESKPEPITPVVPKMTFYKSLVSERPPAEAALVEKPTEDSHQSTTPAASPEAKSEAATPVETASGYAVQVASFTRADQAAALVDALKQQGYPAYAYPVRLAEQSYFRVRVGPAVDSAGAEAYLERLTRAGFKGLFVTRQGD